MSATWHITGPAIKSVLTLDGLAFRVMDCTAEAGILAIELEAAKT